FGFDGGSNVCRRRTEALRQSVAQLLARGAEAGPHDTEEAISLAGAGYWLVEEVEANDGGRHLRWRVEGAGRHVEQLAGTGVNLSGHAEEPQLAFRRRHRLGDFLLEHDDHA